MGNHRILLGLLSPLYVLAQTTAGAYSISGSVLNSVTGEPVKGALVTAFSFSAGENIRIPRTSQNVTTAGPSGEYVFTGLVAGQYTLRAEKPGFIPQREVSSAGTPIVALSLSSSVTGHILKLIPLGVIEGKLANQYGDPLGRVTVELLQSKILNGYRSVVVVQSTASDDRGQFRYWDLKPGKYYVKAMGRVGGTSIYIGNGSVFFDSWEGFRPVYLGGGRDIDSSVPLDIVAATQARADFTLAVEATYKIRGKLENFTSLQGVAFHLIETDENVASSRVSLNGTTGRFEIDDVPSGRYTLRATQGRSRQGETTVLVKDADANGISLALAPAVTVTGAVQVIGPLREKQKTPDNQDDEPEEPSCSLSLRGSGNLLQFVGPGRLGDPKNFRNESVFPGRYHVDIECTAGYAVSAVSGTSDLLANPVLTIQPGVPPPPIEIGMRPGGGDLHGKLGPQIRSSGAGVLLVPAFSASTGPAISFATRESDTPPDVLEFDFENLAPGDYVAYAFSDISSVEYRNPAVLNALTGGTSVRIEEGQTTEITLATANQ